MQVGLCLGWAKKVGKPVSFVTYLIPAERPRMNTDILYALCDTLGPRKAEDVVARALEDLAARLCLVQDLAVAGTRSDLCKELRALRAVAAQIGLTGVSEVAQDVLTCVEHKDLVGEASTLARLARNGECALTALWDLQDLSV